jgi:hypothetical protein
VRHFIYIILLGGTCLRPAVAFADDQPGKSVPHRIPGHATNSLLPVLIVEKFETDWTIEIDYIAQTNFPRNTWLRITNRVGSRLEAWSAYGTVLKSTNQAVLAAMTLPAETTVAEIMKGVRPPSIRGMQWLGTDPGLSFTAASFGLRSAFTVPVTNDLVLQITPLIYKVDTNKTTACLVEFPAIKLRLFPDGNIQKIE